MGIELRPLSPSIGAEVVGIDVASDVDDATFDEILGAWHEHLVLLFRDQELSTDEQIAFAGRFGELERVRTNPAARDTDQVMFVANRPVEGRQGVLPDGEMYFHTDQCYYENPCQATMLYAIEVPSAGGNTLFANAQDAWSELPAHLQARVIGKHALNVYDYEAGATKGTPNVSPDAPRFVHPVVTRHPVTGKAALYVNRLMTARIEDGDEDGQLLQALFDHQEQRQFVYEHVWRPGDLVIWDNRAMLHARTDFDRSETRILRRVTVKGERPVAYAPSVLA